MKIPAMCLVMAGVGVLYAEQYRMNAADALNSSSFNTAGHWVKVSGGAAATEAPGPGNDYVLNGGYMLRTPAAGGNYTFQGDSLTFIHPNSYLAFKGKAKVYSDVITVPDLRFDGGYVQNASDDTHFYLDGKITILNDKGLSFQMVEPSRRGVTVRAPITGGGLLRTMTPVTNDTSNANVAFKCVYLEGDNSGFTGKIMANGGGTFGVNSDAALGAVPETLVPDAITFHGTCWHVTNILSVAATRGIVVGNESNITAHTGNSRRPGMRIQISPTGDLILNGPISGEGPIVKTGDSGYLHIRGSLADYHGTMRLERGVTWFDGGLPVSLSKIELSSGLALGQDAITVADFSWEKGNFWFYPQGVDPTTPRLVVTDHFMFPHDEDVTVQVFDMPGEDYGTWFALMKAPGTALSAALAKDWIRPYGGSFYLYELKVEDNGDGTETLWLRRRPAENVYYHSEPDPIDTTSFTLKRWKHNKSDAAEEPSAPAAGNIYVVDQYLIRSPGFDDSTFVGDALYFMGMGLTLKGPKYRLTMPKVYCYNKCGWWNSEASKPCIPLRIAGRMHLVPGGDYALQLGSTSQRRQISVEADLVGSGSLRLIGMGNPAYGHPRYAISLFGDNRDFCGATYVQGQTNFFCHILSEESLGMNPRAFTAKQLQFNGAGLVVTNNVTLDDANRGIWLETAGGTCDTLKDDASDGASYAEDVPAEDRKYPGGAWFNAEGTDTVLRVDCTIGGAGTLSVYSEGTVALAGANTYSGGTVVRKGALKPLVAAALGTGSLEVLQDGTLVVPDVETAPNGVELSNAITFETGAKLRSEELEAALAAGQTHVTVPLLLLAAGQTVDLDAVPVPGPLPKNFTAVLKTETVSVGGVERVRVSAEVRQVGFMMLFR